MERVGEMERRLECEPNEAAPQEIPDKDLLLSLAQDLPAVWNSPAADMRLKQRIARILIKEIVVEVDQEKREVVLLIHWAGGRHSELRVKKRRKGDNGRTTSLEALEIIRRMTGRFNDENIATTLNHLGMKTGAGKTWNQQRISAFRYNYQLRPAEPIDTHRKTLTMDQAADRLGISNTAIRHMSSAGSYLQSRLCLALRGRLRPEDLELETVAAAVIAIKDDRRSSRRRTLDSGSLPLEF